MKKTNNQAVSLLGKHFSNFEDPCGCRGRLHKYQEILIIGTLATISGADEWTEMEDYAINKKPFLSAILELPNGIPSHDAFGRVFRLVNPEEFQKYFSLWIQDLCDLLVSKRVKTSHFSATNSLDLLCVNNKDVKR